MIDLVLCVFTNIIPSGKKLIKALEIGMIVYDLYFIFSTKM